jgi:hypothetical protein
MGTKARRNASTPTPRPSGARAPRINLTLDPEAEQRLRVHASMTRENPGAIVSRLILEGLKRYRVADMERPSPSPRLAEAVETEAA